MQARKPEACIARPNGIEIVRFAKAA